ncbi:reverse transcriptase domain-containing protein [Tanacetum coccineum]|uniref:Reverse transcriptase domain-containing protein n=1 Tax=Tanacetum coccineum TaxID=301880 RepID=A0ABQ5IZP4_9ASTR
MVNPAEKRDLNKYCKFHADTGHSTDECMQLRKQIDEMIKSGEEDGTEGPMIIEAEIGGHFIHRIYVDGGASSEVLYEHCFIRLRPEIRSQMIPATTSLIGFSRETIWPIGQISLLVKIGDEEHSTYAWMNFMVIRSPSQHNRIIGRTGIIKIRSVPSTAHGMLKFPVEGGTVMLRSSRVIPMECKMISRPSTQHPETSQVLEEKIKVDIHPEDRLESRVSLQIPFQVLPGRIQMIPPNQNGKEVHKEERFPIDSGNRSSLQTDEETHRGAPNADRTKGKGGANHVLSRGQGSYQCSLNDDKGRQMQITVVSLVCRALSRIARINYTPWEKTVGVFKGLAQRKYLSCQGYQSKDKYWRILSWNDGGKYPGLNSLARTEELPNLGLCSRWSLPVHRWGVSMKHLMAGLRWMLEQMGVKNLQAKVDSRLVANQVNGSYVAKESCMVQYLEKVKTLTSNFKEFFIKQVPRSENKKADALSKIASTSFTHLSKQVLVEELKEKSINEKEVLVIVEEEAHTWMTPICENLSWDHGSGASDHFKQTTSLEKYTKDPAACTPVLDLWSLRIDIAGPFPEGPGKVKFLIVAIDYFTKWIEAKPVATIIGNQVKKFVWDNIVCRFGLLGEIVSDNGKQFRDNSFKYWCEKLCIRQCFASVKHPQINGLVERANRSLGEGIKLDWMKESKEWIRELSHVLMRHSHMIKSSNRETPFSLTYGTKAVIPAEIGMPTLPTAEVDLIKNDEALEINLDLIQEKESKQQFKM